jgi:hypothetical protein
MLNKIPTEPEILASKVDHVAAKNDYYFFQNLTLKGRTGEVVGNKGFYVVIFS